MRTSPSRLLLLAGLALVAGLSWLGVEWWIVRQPVGEDFSAEVARLTGDVPEAPARLAVQAGPVRLAVGPLGLTDAAAEGAVADLLVAELSGDKVFQLVERRDFARLMQEFELGAAGAIKPADAVRLGRMLGADWFVLGGAYRAGAEASAVVRIVDAASGIVRDLLVLPGGQEPTRAAASLAALLRRQRTGAAAAGELPEFVAVGGFEDLSVRPRHAGVEAELRSHLTATLAAGPMIVLERELTRLLLEEIRLQQAGLIETTNPPPRLQSTFWLVDGFWQSFDSVGDDVELSLRVSRIGGAVQRRNLRAKLGPPLKSAAANAMVDLFRNAPPPDRPATRKGEIRALLAKGMERARLSNEDLEPERWYVRLRFNMGADYQERMRRQNDLVAAVSIFETVLLLDPDHADAKLFLARCLVDPVLGKPDEARGIWRELTGSKQGDVVRLAYSSLVYSYIMSREPQRAVETAKLAVQRARNNTHKRLFEELQKSAESALLEPERTKAASYLAADAELFGSVRSWSESMAQGQPFRDRSEFFEFVNYRHGDKFEGQIRLMDLLPRLIAAAPELEAYLLARAFQCVTPDQKLASRFELSLAKAAAAPGQIPSPELYFGELDGCLAWAIETKQGAIAAKVSDAIMKARRDGIAINLSERSLVRHGLALCMVDRWRDAMKPFQEITRPVVDMDFEDPMGRYPAYLAPMSLIRDCRRKLGEAEPLDESRFETGRPLFKFDENVVFAPDVGKLWIASGSHLLEHHTTSGMTITHQIGVLTGQSVMALALAADSVWIGTSTGLLRFHRSERTLKRYTISEGLLFNEISALHLSGERLWIGYSHADRGGLSVMEMHTGKIRTLTPVLPFGQASDDGIESNTAPKRPVRSIFHGGEDELLVGTADFGLLQLEMHQGNWRTLMRIDELYGVECVASSTAWAVAGVGPRAVLNKQMPLGLWHGRLRVPVVASWGEILPYPAVTALALDGDRLWVGGPAYLAILDLSTREILRSCLMNNTEVRHLAIYGDDVWVRLNRAIYRFPRSLAYEGGP